MAIVMRLCGTAYDGQFLMHFDHEAGDGEGMIDMTRDVGLAKRFADIAEAVEFHQRSPACKPTRPDGLPNRPLTATTWEFRHVD